MVVHGNATGVDFGREVRRRRKVLGLTLEQLAERSGLTPNYLGTVEAGKRDPSLSTVFGIAKGLGIPAGDLLGSSGELAPASREAARIFEEAPSDVQSAVLALLRAVARKRR
jgi:transcriptional regulator with XRE-family HTH domain